MNINKMYIRRRSITVFNLYLFVSTFIYGLCEKSTINTYHKKERKKEKKKKMGIGDEVTVSLSEQLFDGNLNFPDYEQRTSSLTLNRQRCLDPTLIDSFLRTLRHSSDDVIKQKLNNYNKQTEHQDKSKIQRCNIFLNKELYPNWKVRDQIIDYCAGQAEELKIEIDSKAEAQVSDASTVDTRLDPYSQRDKQFQQEQRYKQLDDLNAWVSNNRGIESILRNTSDHILKHNCDQNEDYIKKFWQLNSN